jgi:hypothetical protein
MKFCLFLALACSCSAQDLASKASVKVVKLTAPEYPSIARAAGVFGWVNLKVAIDADGNAKVVGEPSGPQMLKKAAIESAEHSTFQLLNEGHNHELYDLAYHYELKFLDCDEAVDSSAPAVQYTDNVITVKAQSSPICDPPADRRVRSARCLFLWRCGWRAH